MKNAKPVTFKQFSQLPLEQRQKQFKFFQQKHPKLIPVILASTSLDIPQLKNCKYHFPQSRFLIRQDDQFMAIMEQLRAYIRKNCHLKPDEQLFFYVKSKILNQGQKAKDLYAKIKKQLPDGWLVITYNKENVFGAF